jgi:hypothetical protein
MVTTAVLVNLVLSSQAFRGGFDEDKGGKGEHAPTPAEHLVTKFNIAKALDGIFDGNYAATGKMIDGFNVYKNAHGKLIYPGKAKVVIQADYSLLRAHAMPAHGHFN